MAELRFPDNSLGTIQLEMAPREYMPHTVLYFLDACEKIDDDGALDLVFVH